MRQVNLSTVLVFRRVANKVLARFPTYRSLVDAGLMMPHEATYLTDIDSRSYTFYNANVTIFTGFSSSPIIVAYFDQQTGSCLVPILKEAIQLLMAADLLHLLCVDKIKHKYEKTVKIYI